MIHEYQVIFGDTDQMVVVYYANYLRFFEGSRAAYWRACGRTHKDLDDWGVALPVVEAQCRYRKPARYEDVLQIHVEIAEMDRPLVRLLQRGDGAHERRLARAIRAEETEESLPDVERDVIERADTVGIGLGKPGDGEHRR